MNRRTLACRIAEENAADEDLVVRVLGFADGAVALFRGMEEVAFRVLAECQEESEDSAIGWSKDRAVWCVVCPERSGLDAIRCRIAEELHLYDGLDSPLARDAGLSIVDRPGETLATLAADENGRP